MCTLRLPAVALAAALAALSFAASAVPTYSALIAFGDSLSDPGNAADAIDGGLTPFPPGSRQSTPIPGPGFVAGLPYAATNRLSNGPVWVEQFADSLGLSADRLSVGGTNFAVGGARLGGDGPSTVPEQVDLFFFLRSLLPPGTPIVPPGALISFWGGSNDARDAAMEVLDTGDPGAADDYITDYSTALHDSVLALAAAGAGDILLPNIPNLGSTPEVNFPPAEADAPAVSEEVSRRFNEAFDETVLLLEASIAGAGLAAELIVLDVFTLLEGVVLDPAAFGLTNVTDACAFECPEGEDNYLFFDGIHPTTAGHAILAAGALRAVPAPATALLLATGLLLGLRARRSRAGER